MLTSWSGSSCLASTRIHPSSTNTPTTSAHTARHTLCPLPPPLPHPRRRSS